MIFEVYCLFVKVQYLFSKIKKRIEHYLIISFQVKMQTLN